jgi:hypothetical protein
MRRLGGMASLMSRLTVASAEQTLETTASEENTPSFPKERGKPRTDTAKHSQSLWKAN